MHAVSQVVRRGETRITYSWRIREVFSLVYVIVLPSQAGIVKAIRRNKKYYESASLNEQAPVAK